MNLEFFQERYPENYPANIDPDKYESVVDIFNGFVKRFADRPAFSCLGQTLTYSELDRQSAAFAAYLQNETTLVPGDRIAIQLPNILQYPIVVFGAMRAGMVVVNTNPLYTEREMEHQFNDAGAKALVVLANMADKAEAVLPNTGIKHVIITNVGDMHGTVKRLLINSVLKYVKKEVPSVNIPGVVPLRKALSLGGGKSFTPAKVDRNDVAVLQYTGGTTGVAKGAMLTHRNLISNMMQCHGLFNMILDEGKETVIAPLPLYHIYAFTVHCMVLLHTGNHSVLIPNPRDIPGFIKTLQTNEFSGFVGLNTLFVALCGNETFRALDFSKLKLTISGGMALTKDAADQWKSITGCEVAEGYGMTETSPVVSFNPPGYVKLGTIGMPVSSTACKVVDDDGVEQPIGQPGELCVKGPQVMKGYWQRPEATAETITDDGWLKTGDMAVISEDGYMKIVDRKKDMIIVSGFNVYPNEVEDVVVSHPDILEAAAIGVPDAKSSEAVKVFVVSKNENLTAAEIKEFCRENLTAYKVPRYIEFRDELPKTNVGKILRRELRDQELAKES
ncbi:MAG: long-chain fatty acid--CoA ligase [Oceanospirillaceae bacterium]|uniref:AMP-binding protein n=3 Tax=unclassified Thalassolituus TaxID=2624967 RepID=UPI000C6AC76D|nr:AMP-binding protein [Thalassolituus sp. UBA1505]MAX99765.1 long-chain fatty acid--CoA ligase [Oceanospirillaceae bacterium]MBS54961.1 long-chain fatty acid--CoA ligase [Oceanospirillaceae bacterium]|tara:strand:+ start:1226 stop:2905 length:1680 start_codon:yes stop_codon:yes gene_type:complete